MIRMIGKLALAAVLTAVLAMTPATVSAQTNTTVTTNAAPAKPKAPRPFRGKIVAIDKAAKTFTVGTDVKRVYAITSTTKLMKSGKPAMFDDFIAGDSVSISSSTNADGKLEAKSVGAFVPPPAKKAGAATTGGAAAPAAAPATTTPPAPKQP